MLETRRETLSQDDYLAVPFDMSSEQDKAVFEALTHNKEGFQAWRENMARTHMHMELADYNALFEQHRTSLLDLAASVEIPVHVNSVSFDALLRKVDAEVSVRERRSPKGAAAFVEARVTVAALHQNAHLFRARSTLHSLVIQDAVMFGVQDQIGQAFDWIVSKIQANKCTYCKAVYSFIIKKACQAAGSAICKMLIAAATGPIGVILGKYLCDAPLFMSKILGGVCDAAVTALLTKARITAECVCSVTVPTFSIPATDFKVLGASVFKMDKRTIAIGLICPVVAGQCIGSSTSDKKAYDAQKAVDDAKKAAAAKEERAKIAKMTKAEKIAYHTKVLKGEIKSNLTEQEIHAVLGSVTGLTSAALAGLKKLATGDVKGAAVAVAKGVATTAAKAVGEVAVGTAVKAVTKTTTNAVAMR